MIGDYGFETMNNIGEDRMVRATLPLTTKATLLFETELRKSTFEKRYSVKKINFKTETQTFNADVENPPPMGYDNSTNLDDMSNKYKALDDKRQIESRLGLNQRHIDKNRYSK